MYNNYGYPCYQQSPYYSCNPYYFDYRNNYAYPYNFGTPLYNQYYHYYGNPTNVASRQDPLGTRWEGQELLWKWKWVRRGNSNVFDATYVHPHDKPVTATVTIEVIGNQVVARMRNASGGGDCDYKGYFTSSNTVTGTFVCTDWTTPGRVEGWSATIYHDGPGTETGPGPGTETGPGPGTETGPTTSIPFEFEFLRVFRVKGTVYPDQQQVTVAGYIGGIKISEDTWKLEQSEIPFETTQFGQTLKLIVGIGPGGNSIYTRGEIKVGGRIIAKSGPHTIVSW